MAWFWFALASIFAGLVVILWHGYQHELGERRSQQARADVLRARLIALKADEPLPAVADLEWTWSE